MDGVRSHERGPRPRVVVGIALVTVVLSAAALGSWLLRGGARTNGVTAPNSLNLATTASVTLAGANAPFTATASGPSSFVPGRDIEIHVTLASPGNRSMVLQAGSSPWTGRVSGSLGAIETVGPGCLAAGNLDHPSSCSADPFFIRLGAPSKAWPGGTGGTVPASHTILVHTSEAAPGRYVLIAEMQYAPVVGSDAHYVGTATVRVTLDVAGTIRMETLHDARRRISLRYPSNWRVATKAISADRFFAAAFATFPLPSSGARCEARPAAALAALGSSDAFVYIELVDGNPYDYGARPTHFGPRSGTVDEGPPPCGQGVENRRYNQWISFHEAGSGVIVSIAFGDLATKALRTRVYHALDTLKVAAA